MTATMDETGAGLKFDLQAQINAAADGAVVAVPPDEYAGPFVLRKPVTLRGGAGATLSAGSGPVLVVDSPGVVLENVIIEVGNAAVSGPEGCALQVNSGYTPRTENVQVKGSVMGVPGEEGVWNLPSVSNSEPSPRSRASSTSRNSPSPCPPPARWCRKSTDCM